MTNWMTTTETATYAGFKSVKTILRAAGKTTLHGHQLVESGSWRFDSECVDRWLTGRRCTAATCRHKKVTRLQAAS